MHSPTMQQSFSRNSQDEDFEKATRRKPLPNETENGASYASPQTSTIRMVSNQTVNSDSSELGTETSGGDHLIPNFSKLNVGKTPNSSEANTVESNTHNNTITRRSLDKPLPMPPVTESEPDNNGNIPEPYDQRAIAFSKTQDLERELGVEGQVDLSNTTDVEVLEHWAPAVTHETIIQDVHEVREERITREIHEDHYYHRILPIEEVEVLPARHYVLDPNGIIREVPAQHVPGRVSKDAQRVVAEGFKKMQPKSTSSAGPRTFTAREFPGDEGDYKEYVTPEGVPRSERYWVHPPKLATGGMESGQTQPFHFGSSNPEHDGWRTGVDFQRKS